MNTLEYQSEGLNTLLACVVAHKAFYGCDKECV